jgi:hypothetical protein
VLRADSRLGAGFSKHLRESLGIPIEEVPLESLVSVDSLKQGVAPEVVALGGR